MIEERQGVPHDQDAFGANHGPGRTVEMSDLAHWNVLEEGPINRRYTQ